MYNPPALPPPGWYPDPERAGSLRWWSGTEWALSSASFTAPTDQLPEVSAMLGGAFRRVLRRWRSLLVLALLTGAVPMVLWTLAVKRLLDDVAIVDGEVVGWSNDRLPGAIAMTVVAIVAGWIGYLATTWLMLCAYDEEAEHGATLPTLSTTDELTASMRALAAAGAALPRAVGWALLAVLAGAVALAALVALTAFALPLGIMFFIALIPLTVWVLVKAAFLPHALVDARGNPYSRSWVVSQERFWSALGRVLILVVVAGAINYGVGIAGAVASGGGTFGSGAAVEVDSNGDLADVELERLYPVTPVSVVAAALTSLVATVFGTSMLLAGCCEIYRTRNPRSR